jgi:hypothetical protein
VKRAGAVLTLFVTALVGFAPAGRAAGEVVARLERERMTVGESVGLEVVVSGAGGGIVAPALQPPAGLEVLGVSRAENYSWINGRSSSQTIFHYEIGALRPGRYTLGPIRVQAGRQVFASGVVQLVVTSAGPGLAAASGAASLFVDVTPREPWVGEPVLLRVRLVLAQDLSEEPAYVPPVTTGFWAEAPSRPQSYYATQAGRRVLVTETRSRLYPLAPGLARIGSAGAGVVLADRGAADPLRWISGQVPRRELTLRSQPIEVRVRPLPPGAPAGFDGAVGVFTVGWFADRRSTSQDVPVAVRLEVRGVGNLPLVKLPALTSADGEVFAGTADDSLPAPGAVAAGRRRFQWNVLPRHPGALSIPAPAFAWFDPGAGVYRSVALPPLAVEVGPPVFSSGRARESFPGIFLLVAPDPFARGVAPWAWALAGLLAGAAAVVWRIRLAGDPHAQARVRVVGWRNALRAPGGAAFWRAAEEATAWLEGNGRPLGEVRAQVVATRYGGRDADVEGVRSRLTGELKDALPAAPSRGLTRPAAVVLAGLAVVLVGLSGVSLGDSARSLRLRAVDRVARDGDVARAQTAWLGMWQEGAHEPALAARLAWVEVTRGALGPAAVWVLRGEQAGARDPALAWVSDLVREGGGLTGARPVRLPVRRVEWAMLALALGLAAGALWPRRALAVAVAVLSLCAGGMEPIQDAWAAHVAQSVVSRSVTLEGTGLELEAGQVVQVLRGEGASTRVRAGRDLEGRVPASALLPVGEVR